ncbi:MAG TPA: AraC family transcriptional regulator, partial [Pirellulales bacterium]|nr:AraC family transcriptional regulator [Pirellulales bacterium]
MGQSFDVPDGDGSPSSVRHALPPGLMRALAWLNGRLDQPIQLETLAAAAGVRPRTLEAHFKLYLRTTPLGWVRRMRLARARQQLLLTDEDANVTAVAQANGFTELGRFAGQYRRQFGELPSQTLKSVRVKSAAADEIDDEALRLSWRALASAFMVGPASCSAALA